MRKKKRGQTDDSGQILEAALVSHDEPSCKEAHRSDDQANVSATRSGDLHLIHEAYCATRVGLFDEWHVVFQQVVC